VFGRERLGVEINDGFGYRALFSVGGKNAVKAFIVGNQLFQARGE
jgi:hypothetical protein